MILEVRAVAPFYKNGFVVACERTREAVLIDPGDEVDQLLGAVQELEVEPQSILLTHAHVDHITGVAVARETFAETRTGLDHASFGVAQRADLDTWADHFKKLNVSQSPITDRDGYAVLVFRDPDNIQLELISMG